MKGDAAADDAHKLIGYIQESHNKHNNKEQIEASAENVKELFAPMTRAHIEEVRAAYGHITGHNMRGDISSNRVWTQDIDAISLYTKGKDRLSKSNVQELCGDARDEGNYKLFAETFNQASRHDRVALRVMLDKKGTIDVGNHIFTISGNGTLKTLTDDARAFRKLFPKNSNHINQGDYGTCYLDSSLLAISRAECGEFHLAKMIKPDGHGAWNVTLPSNPLKPIKVARDDIDNFAWEKKGVTGSLGIRILEAAYGKERELKGEVPKYSLADEWRDNFAMGRLGGTKRHLLAAGTGGSSNELLGELVNPKGVLRPDWNHDNVHRALDFWAAHGPHMAVTASTEAQKNFKGPVYYDVEKKMHTADPEHRIIFGHAYIVVGIDPARKEVTIANPWDTKKAFKQSYDDFYKYFAEADGVRVQTAPAIKNK